MIPRSPNPETKRMFQGNDRSTTNKDEMFFKFYTIHTM